MNNKRKDKPLTEMQLRFVAAFTGNATAAAREAGSKHPKLMAKRMMKDPRILTAIREKQAVVIRASGEALIHNIKITRNDIINRLDYLSQHAETDSTKVSALGHLRDIFGLSASKHDEPYDFSGWTDDELLEFVNTRRLPARFRYEQGAGGGDERDPKPGTPKVN
jgi:hypothetical protein